MTMQQFFAEHPRAAIAFSGGVDSSYLLYAAQQCGADVQAYFVKGAFQPEFELEDAQRLAKDIGAKIKILRADVLADSTVTANPANRCYYCKKVVFAMIAQAAREDGYTLILDGTNASDDSADRPGMKALEELSVLSPLRICGLTKAEIREKSREAGLFTWDKPSYACLATRVPTGTRITAEILEKTEKAEGYLFSLGFSDFRIRYLDGAAKIQMPRAQLPRVMEYREEILAELKKYYSAVLLDLEVRGE
jgi:uncharacterized protein